jgi:hypothetical protein
MIFGILGYGIMGTLFVPLRQVFSPRGNVALLQSLVLLSLSGVLALCWLINSILILAGKKSVLLVNSLITYHYELSSGKLYNNCHLSIFLAKLILA